MLDLLAPVLLDGADETLGEGKIGPKVGTVGDEEADVDGTLEGLVEAGDSSQEDETLDGVVLPE